MGLLWSDAGLKAVLLPQAERGAVLARMGAAPLKPGFEESTSKTGPFCGPAGNLAAEIRNYFRGQKTSFAVTLDWAGCTAFQRLVLEIVRGIPYGEVRTYGQVARQAGRAGGARAVGQALRTNRFPLIIPCHRVVAAGGLPGGYSGGADMKKRLLELEKAPCRAVCPK